MPIKYNTKRLNFLEHSHKETSNFSGTSQRTRRAKVRIGRERATVDQLIVTARNEKYKPIFGGEKTTKTDTVEANIFHDIRPEYEGNAE